MSKRAKKEFKFDMTKDPEKIVMIGDQLTTDILFGNINSMPTIWVKSNKD